MTYEEIRDSYREDTSGRKYFKPTTSSKSVGMHREKPREVVSYNMNAPMSFETFMKLSDDAQIAYIKHLSSEYGANGTDIRKMFGVSKTTFHVKVITRLNLLGLFERGKKMPREMIEKWNKFLGVDDTCKTECSEDEASNESADSVVESKDERSNYTLNTMCTTMTFCGEMNSTEISNRISALVPNGTKCTITISITREGYGNNE